MNIACVKVWPQGCKIDDIDKIVELTVCPKQEGADYHHKESLNRDCDQCVVDKLDTFYKRIINLKIIFIAENLLQPETLMKMSTDRHT